MFSGGVERDQWHEMFYGISTQFILNKTLFKSYYLSQSIQE